MTKVKPEPEYGDPDTKLTIAEPSIDDEKGCYQSFKEWPKSVFFIVGNECCERFSYYGMRTILTLYVRNILNLSADDSIALFHGFTVAAYFTPILGSILADGFIGKFYTILWLSLLYAAGNIILSVAAFFKTGDPVHPGLDALGLAVIALGTGGIKPCVQPFGADQFKKGQEKLLVMFFSVFYFAINAGSTISTFVTPIMRSTPCLGQDSCYPLAFGVPAILMIVACGFFVFGSFFYTKYPPKGNVLVQVVKYMSRALINRRRFSVKREHWVEHYMDDHSCDSVCRENGTCAQEKFGQDIKAVLRVLVMFVPLPIFWALYDQQGSRWVLQATLMDGRLNDDGTQILLPDQTQVINPICIMILIPIFQAIIYPLLGKCFNITPLRKMTVGGLLAVLAYVVAGLVQGMINDSLPVIPDKNAMDLYIINPTNQDLTFSMPLFEDGKSRDIIANSYLKLANINCEKSVCDTAWLSPKNGTAAAMTPVMSSLTLSSQFRGPQDKYRVFYSVINEDLTINDTVPYCPTVDHALEKSSEGNGQFKLTLNLATSAAMNKEIAVVVCSLKDNKAKSCESYDSSSSDKYYVFENITALEQLIISDNDAKETLELKPGAYGIYASETNADLYKNKTVDAVFEKKPWGGIYAGFITKNKDGYSVNVAQLAPDNSVNVFWQLPQMIIISIGEILFSITGNEFSYSQAPLSMKSVIAACWLLSVAIGDVIDLFIAEAHPFDNEAYIYYLFAGIMLVVIIIFACMAQFWYTYVTYLQEGETQPLKKPVTIVDDSTDVKKVPLA